MRTQYGICAVFFVILFKSNQELETAAMGRRALPKLDPNVDFSQYISEVHDLQVPFCPQSLFAQTADLEIEIGSGKGLFLLNESGHSPDRNFLGNEIASKYCRFAAYRLAKNERSNAYMLRGDGLKLFRDFLPSECAVAVHVYFPDPWWKERHRRRRVIQPGFIADLQRVLVGDGIFHFWTDVKQYFDEAVGLIGEHSNLIGPIDVKEKPAKDDMDFRTHFERRMRKYDHDVFRAQFKKS